MPDKLRASHSTGGKLDGTLNMVTSIPASARYSQKARPWRRSEISPPSRGYFQPASCQNSLGAFASEMERNGVRVAGSR